MFRKTIKKPVAKIYKRDGIIYKNETKTDWDAVKGAIVIVVVVIFVIAALAN